MKLNKQRWIAFDQWLHTLYDVNAFADEAFSARCWREYLNDPSNKKWAGRVKRIDRWALKLFDDYDHCRASYVSEQLRNQLPPSYRN